jgi:hypothetical protein
MTPEQKIKHLIMIRDADMMQQYGDDRATVADDIAAHGIDKTFDLRNEDWGLQDAMEEVRGGEVETGLKCDWSRHYESKAVAAQAVDGSWVGWTYWYGGGRHGEPEAVEWMDSAYDLSCVEEEKVVTVRTFSVIQP